MQNQNLTDNYDWEGVDHMTDRCHAISLVRKTSHCTESWLIQQKTKTHLSKDLLFRKYTLSLEFLALNIYPVIFM